MNSGQNSTAEWLKIAAAVLLIVVGGALVWYRLRPASESAVYAPDYRPDFGRNIDRRSGPQQSKPAEQGRPDNAR